MSVYPSTRTVDTDLQERFAALSGDRNPMHMDPAAARRTQAGQPVVHGVHTLLWALEELAQAEQLPGSIAGHRIATGPVVPGPVVPGPVTRLKAKFLKWVYLHDLATLQLRDREPGESLQLEVAVEGLIVLTAEVSFSKAEVEKEEPRSWVDSPDTPRSAAQEWTLSELADRSGDAYVPPAAQISTLFPHLAELLGPVAAAEIAACSYVIGMEAPGLHSMFSKLDLTLNHAPVSQPPTALHYIVSSVDERFRKLRIAVQGRAVGGVLDAFVRVPPVRQASMELVAKYVQPNEFAGMNALVIGGSRGLGELTAKLIAAGGGAVTVTYALGRAEAEALVSGIRAFGGIAAALPYDVRQPAAEQVRALQSTPTHVFYFATSTIFRPKLGVLSGPMLAELLQFYVEGFYDLCVALIAAGVPASQRLSVFYPSTVYLEERPAGMAEYAMAKAAGEQMCADMNLYMPELSVLVHRLPKLPTDQTAGVLPERETDALEALLPVIRTLSRETKAL